MGYNFFDDIEEKIQRYNRRLRDSLSKDYPDRFEISELERQEQWLAEEYQDVPHPNVIDYDSTEDVCNYKKPSATRNSLSLPIPSKPKKVFYKHSYRTPHCWKCKTDLDSRIDEECPTCGWIICPTCGACKHLCDGGFERMGNKKPIREFTATSTPDDILDKPNSKICGRYRNGECFGLDDCQSCSDFIQVPLETLKL